MGSWRTLEVLAQLPVLGVRMMSRFGAHQKLSSSARIGPLRTGSENAEALVIPSLGRAGIEIEGSGSIIHAAGVNAL